MATASNVPQAHDFDGRIAFVFKNLGHASLIVDAVYSGGNLGNRARRLGVRIRA